MKVSEALAVAVGHHQGGRLQAAEQIYRQVLAVVPANAEVLSGLGNALKGQGKLDEAIACYRRALELKPDSVEALNNLGNALKALGKFDDAIACYRRLLELRPDVVEAHSNLGVALHTQGKLHQAVACYRRALELKPNYAEAHHNLGNTLQQLGDLRGAEDSFRAALRYNPRLASAHGELARLLGGRLPEDDLAAQRRLLEEPGLTERQRTSLHFGLAQVLDARGEYAEAAAHLERANALQRADWERRGRHYDPQEHEAFVTRSIRFYTPDFFRRVGGFGLPSELPVFVVGLPRSGTTLVEQILASHSQVAGAGELSLVGDTVAALEKGDKSNSCGDRRLASVPASGPFQKIGLIPFSQNEGVGRMDRATAHRLAARHLEKLRSISPAALRIVDKTPENYLYLGLLASLFPRAKLIHCRRDLRDVAVSCWMTAFGTFRCWASDQRHIASRFHQYQRIMDHWRKVLPAPMLEVDYEETVADLEGMARRLLAWCGLAWEPACLEFHRTSRPVTTASSIQVRRPVFSTSVGRWKHYQHALAPLLAELS